MAKTRVTLTPVRRLVPVHQIFAPGKEPWLTEELPGGGKCGGDGGMSSVNMVVNMVNGGMV